MQILISPNPKRLENMEIHQEMLGLSEIQVLSFKLLQILFLGASFAYKYHSDYERVIKLRNIQTTHMLYEV